MQPPDRNLLAWDVAYTAAQSVDADMRDCRRAITDDHVDAWIAACPAGDLLTEFDYAIDGRADEVLQAIARGDAGPARQALRSYAADQLAHAAVLLLDDAEEQRLRDDAFLAAEREADWRRQEAFA